jgi:hypothetical protein
MEEPDIYIEIPHNWSDCPPCWHNFMSRLTTIPGWGDMAQSEVYRMMDLALAEYGAERFDWDEPHAELKFKDSKSKSYFILRWS